MLDKPDFTYISNWTEKKLTCSHCGSKKSVKYLDGKNKPRCNRCVFALDPIPKNQEYKKNP